MAESLKRVNICYGLHTNVRCSTLVCETLTYLLGVIIASMGMCHSLRVNNRSLLIIIVSFSIQHDTACSSVHLYTFIYI